MADDKQKKKGKLRIVFAAFKKLSWPIRLLILFLVVALLGVSFTCYRIISIEGGGMTPQGIRAIAQLSTLEYRYKEVIVLDEQEEFLLFGLWDIDPGESILVVQYDGIIKLGVDCEKIEFTETGSDEDGRTRIEIKMPAAEIISSETPLNSFEVIVNKGVFTKRTVDLANFYNVAGKRQVQRNMEVLQGEFGQTAQDNARRQLQAMFDSFTEIQENYDIVWID